jgi:hypothetical protein
MNEHAEARLPPPLHARVTLLRCFVGQGRSRRGGVPNREAGGQKEREEFFHMSARNETPEPIAMQADAVRLFDIWHREQQAAE